MLNNNDLKLRTEELTENPTARVPVYLVLDTSYSMKGEKINELNSALAEFVHAVQEDEMAAISAEIAVVTFGGSVTQILDFSSIERQHMPVLQANGNTPMGEAVELALDQLEQTKRIYSKMGVDYFQPWLVLMTDGEPTDSINEAVTRCRQLIMERPQKLTLFPVAIGSDANLDILGQFSPSLLPFRANAAIFRQFFSWLAKSINTVSTSNPGDTSSASFGETSFKKHQLDWETAMKQSGGS